MSSSVDAVLFISFGGPEKSEDIRPFLQIVTRGRRIPPQRIEEVVHHYEQMGGASPINAITRRQAEGLRKELAKSGKALPVYIGNRNWHPFLEDTLRDMASNGVRRAVGFITAAYRSEASLERYINAVEEARKKMGSLSPVIDYVSPWFDHPLFIDAIASRVEQTLKRSGDTTGSALQDIPWVFTAHSIPCSMAKDSTYVQELRETARLVAEKMGKTDWMLAYTSRSGSPTDPWLEPDVCDVIDDCGQQGFKSLLAIPIGFVADHVEVLYDLDVEAKGAAREAVVSLRRAQTVGDHPLFIKMIADVVRRRASQKDETPEMTHSHSTMYRDGRREMAVGREATTCLCQPDVSDPPCCRQETPAHRGLPAS